MDSCSAPLPHLGLSNTGRQSNELSGKIIFLFSLKISNLWKTETSIQDSFTCVKFV